MNNSLVDGTVVGDYKTIIFPIPLAQACSWDIKAIENGARIAAKEATAQSMAEEA